MEVPQNGWFTMKNDFGVPLFMQPSYGQMGDAIHEPGNAVTVQPLPWLEFPPLRLEFNRHPQTFYFS